MLVIIGTAAALALLDAILPKAPGQRSEISNLDNALRGGMGAELASATTIIPTNQVHAVSGIAAISTITAPSGIRPGDVLILIPKGLITFTATGNIAIGVTAVVNRALILVWDGTDWIPSYLL